LKEKEKRVFFEVASTATKKIEENFEVLSTRNVVFALTFSCYGIFFGTMILYLCDINAEDKSETVAVVNAPREDPVCQAPVRKRPK
jgi:hypothetical protein